MADHSTQNPSVPTDTRVRFSLRFKLTIGLIFIIVFIFAGLNAFNIWSHRHTRFSEANNTARGVALLLAGSLTTQLADHDLDSQATRAYLSRSEAAAFKLNRDIAFILVLSNTGAIVSGRARPELLTFPGGKKIGDSDAALREIAARGGKLGRSVRVSKINLEGSGGGGTLMIGLSLARIHAAWRRDLVLNITVFLIALLAIVVYGSLALGSMVVRPLRSMMTSMLAVHEGQLTDADVDVNRRDEIGVLARTYNYMLQGLREREKLEDAFSRYVSRQVYEKLQSGAINLAGEMRNATVLFSDIRSFTNLSEQMQPAEVVAMLNEYFTEMVEIIFKYDGFLNKFIGDAIMAVYNVPLDQSQPELRAVRTGLEMIAALERLNQRRVARGQFEIKIGIGVNTGPVVAGNLGHEKRLEYTVIGDAVNLAQRIESQTKVSGTALLISEATYQPIAGLVEATALPPVKVKGKQEPVALYAVTGVRTETGALPPVAVPPGT